MKNEIVEKVKAAGVVGAGGAGFPSHVKINAQADTVLVNGASCEPLLCSDIYIMENHSKALIQGLRAVMACVGASSGIVCLKSKHGKARKIMGKALESEKNISIFEMDDFYPGGDEHVLVNQVLGRIVPEGGIPLEVGAIVVNVESVYNIAGALEGEPVTHRHLNVAGQVNQPMILRVPIGTPVMDVLKLAGGVNIADYRVIDGGPMMGRVIDDPLTSFVTKTTSGLIVLPPDHNVLAGKTRDIDTIKRIARTVCCQCTLCTQLCPRYLLGHNLHPHLIMRSLVLPKDNSIRKQALLCSGCGICEKWACPMHLSPREVNLALKKEIKGTARDVAANKLKRHDYIDYRRVPSSRLMGKLNIQDYDVKPNVFCGQVMPERVGIYLRQHIGAACIPGVKAGDFVDQGQVIGQVSENSLGAFVHASIKGRVESVSQEMIVLVKE